MKYKLNNIINESKIKLLFIQEIWNTYFMTKLTNILGYHEICGLLVA